MSAALRRPTRQTLVASLLAAFAACTTGQFGTIHIDWTGQADGSEAPVVGGGLLMDEDNKPASSLSSANENSRHVPSPPQRAADVPAPERPEDSSAVLLPRSLMRDSRTRSNVPEKPDDAELPDSDPNEPWYTLRTLTTLHEIPRSILEATLARLGWEVLEYRDEFLQQRVVEALSQQRTRLLRSLLHKCSSSRAR